MDQPTAAGIIRNTRHNVEKRSFLSGWIRAMVSGVPFSLDNEVTSFQVFPDCDGMSPNMSGNACDQVIMHGRVTQGVICDHNVVAVYGKRDSNNNILASSVTNAASGTTVTASRKIPAWGVRLISLLLVGFIVLLLNSIGGAVSSGAQGMAISPAAGLALIAGLLIGAIIVIKWFLRRFKWLLIIGAVLLLVYLLI